MSLSFQPFLDGYYDAAPQLQRHVYRRSEAEFARWDGFKDAIATPEQVIAWQERVRAAALAGLGGLPDGDTPLEPEITGRLSGPGFEVEKVIFQSLPGFFVTANLYLPAGLSAPSGAVVFVCGHGENAKAWPQYQAVCQRFVRNGLVVLAVDPVGQGERKSYLDSAGGEIVRWGTTEHTYAGNQCWWLGQSIARYFVHDIRRAIDYLCSRPEVDPARIGITGNSGGGTQTAWTMLVEPRLAAAAPGTFITRRRDYLWTGQGQDAEQHLLSGTANGIDHEDCLIACAPRPVLVLAVEYDFFNFEGTIAAVERAGQFYKILGKPENLGLAHTPATHNYHPVLARAATEFFVRHLRGGDPREVDHTEPVPFEPAELNCTPSGQLALDRPTAPRVHDLNRAAYRSLATRSALPRERAEAAGDWLAEAVNRGRQPGPLYPRWLPRPNHVGVKVQHGFWWSEQDVLGAGCLLIPADGAFASLRVALFDRGTAELDDREAQLLDWVRGGQAVLALDVRGSGALEPHPVRETGATATDATLEKFSHDLFWLGDSLAATQIYDVRRAVALVRQDPEIGLGDRPVHLYGAGRGAFRAYLAGALDPGIARVELADPIPDFDTLIEERLYLSVEEAQARIPAMLIPGLATVAKLGDLRELYAGRELVTVR
ncbi:MAG TPA: acetylxylan esterase [Chloroflexota bacterium]|nr:acetylxylan esterase [Chloroflexota bacterium]